MAFVPPLPDPDLFDTGEWPLVYGRFPELDEKDRVARVLGSLQSILDQKQRFVIAWIPAGHDHDDEPHEDEKQSMIWLKRHRDELRTWCAGYLYITQDPALTALLNGRFPVVEKFLSFPKQVVGNREEARAVAKLMLQR